MAWRSRGGWSIGKSFLVTLPVGVLFSLMTDPAELELSPFETAALFMGQVLVLPLFVASIVLMQNLIVLALDRREAPDAGPVKSERLLEPWKKCIENSDFTTSGIGEFAPSPAGPGRQ